MFAPKGTLIGTVHEDFDICVPRYSVYDERKQKIFTIVGDVCACACIGNDVNFEVGELCVQQYEMLCI